MFIWKSNLSPDRLCHSVDRSFYKRGHKDICCTGLISIVFTFRLELLLRNYWKWYEIALKAVSQGNHRKLSSSESSLKTNIIKTQEISLKTRQFSFYGSTPQIMIAVIGIKCVSARLVPKGPFFFLFFFLYKEVVRDGFRRNTKKNRYYLCFFPFPNLDVCPAEGVESRLRSVASIF